VIDGPIPKEHPGGSANPMNSDAYKLERLATQLSKEGKWDEAVMALKKAQSLGADLGTRQVKYLQRAGRYEEALAELDALLRAARADIPRLMRGKPTEEQGEALASSLCRLYTDGALIARRQKDAARELEFSRIASEQLETMKRLQPINEERRKNVRLVLEKNKNNKPLYYQLLKMFYPSREN